MDEKTALAFARLIAERVPAGALDAIVESGRWTPEFELIKKAASAEPDQRRLEVAQAVVRHYDDSGDIARLARALRREMWDDDEFFDRIARYLPRHPNAHLDEDAAKEAKLALRANTMRSRKLREFLHDTEFRLCAIASTVRVDGGLDFKKGTGFLVGPDLVLTAYHVVKDQMDDDRPAADSHERLKACFDFYDGATISYPNYPAHPALTVAFHEEWLVASSHDLLRDGMLDPAIERDEAIEIADNLDFALVRLKEPVGRQSRSSAGGERRGWVRLAELAQDLRQDERIIIPQHPNGDPLCIDFGRFSEQLSQSDVSKTRIRYDTETDGGTSGAPCFTLFDTRFQPVGMHNATFKPNGVPEANQAIDIRRIQEKIAPHVPQDPAPEPSRLWNVSVDVDAPRVILRRDTLLDWIEMAATESVMGGRKRRLYAAMANVKRAGLSFSLEILKAARRNRTEPMVVLGAQREPFPSTVADFMGAICDQLSISSKAMESLPTRPASDLPAGSPDGDKLRKWASEDVPNWFDGVLGQHRNSVVDAGAAARQARDILLRANLPVPPDLEKAANSDELISTRRWALCWIVLDGLGGARLSSELQDLIAGLTGGKLAEDSMPQELRRLRWLFLGQPPTFADGTEFTREDLDPNLVDAEHLLACLGQFVSSIQIEMTEGMKVMMQAFIEAAIEQKHSTPEERMSDFQDYCRRVCLGVRRQAGRP